MKNSLSRQIPNADTVARKLLAYINGNIFVSMPAIITAVNYDEQTVTVQPVIKGRINDGNFNVSDVELPLIEDVPFMVYQGGGYYITMPVAVDDEALLVFTDYDFSAWWQNGGVQKAEHLIRHHYSSAMAIIGFNSIPRKLANYNQTGVEVRSADSAQLISITPDGVAVTANNITLNGNTTINGALDVSGTTTIQGKDFLSHAHSNGNQGANTGGVV